MDGNRSRGPASAGPPFDIMARITQIATGAVLIALVGLVFSETILRGLFNISLGFAEEMTGYCVVMLTFFGAALALRSEALFQVNFLFGAFSDRVQSWLLRLFILASLFVCILLALKANDLVLSSLARGKFAPSVLRTPLWIPQLIPPVGFVTISIFLVEKFLLSLRTNEDAN